MLKGICHCGEVCWTLDAMPESITACNCTICRRYGALWAYEYIGHDIRTTGKTNTYRRLDGGAIDFHFCAVCGCVTHYIRTAAGDDGRYRTAVNVRLTELAAISDTPMDRFDGQDSFVDLPRDGRVVRDMWF